MRVFFCFFRTLVLTLILGQIYAQDRTLNAYNPAEPVVSASGSITLLPGFHVPAGSSFHAYISGYNTTPLAPALSQNQNYIVYVHPSSGFFFRHRSVD